MMARAGAILIALGILGVAVAWPLSRPDPRTLWIRANQALQSGRIVEAERLLAEVGRLRAPNGLDWSLRAEVAVARDRPDEALAALARIPDEDPIAAQAALLAGRIERKRDRLPAAEAHLRRAIALSPRLVDAHRELIFILGTQLRRREVDDAFKTLSRLQGLSHHELYTWGLSLFNFPWTPDTVERLEAILRACPEDRRSRLALAAHLSRTPGAEDRVEHVLEPLPRSDPEAAAIRVGMRLDRGRVDEARALLDGFPGDHPGLARSRGRIALIRGDLDAAIRHFRAAMVASPDDRVALGELGKTLAMKGDRAEAERCLGRARRLDAVYDLLNGVHRPDRPNEPRDLIAFGRAYEAAGLLIAARGWYLLAIAADPADAEAQRALHRLGEPGTPPPGG